MFMTTSQISFLSEILSNESIPAGKLAYFRRRLSNRLHALVLSEFARLEKEGKITRAELARRIGRRPEQVTRWLGASGNWTLDTLSDLLLGMKCEASLSVVHLEGYETKIDGTAVASRAAAATPFSKRRTSIPRTFGSVKPIPLFHTAANSFPQ